MLPPYPMLTIKNWDAVSCVVVMTLLGVVMLTGCTPPGPRSLLEGERLIREKNYAKAIDRLKTATEQNAGLARSKAWNFLGLAYHGAGKPADAAAAYQKAIQLDPNLAVAHFNLGCLLLEQNQPAAAVTSLSTYTVLERNRPSGWAKLGAAQLRLNQIDAAENSFRAALGLNPSLPEGLNGMAIVQLHRQRLQEAVDFFNAAVRREPPYGPALLNLAIVSDYYLKNPQMALQRYQTYVDLKPIPPHASAVQKTINRLQAKLAPPVLPIPPESPDPELTIARTNQQPPSEQVASKVIPPAAPDQTEKKPVAQPETNRTIQVASNDPRSRSQQPDSPPSAPPSKTGEQTSDETSDPPTEPPSQPRTEIVPPKVATDLNRPEPTVVTNKEPEVTQATPELPVVKVPNESLAGTSRQPNNSTANTDEPSRTSADSSSSIPPDAFPEEEDPIGAGMIVTRSGERRGGLGQRINPRNWFGDRNQERDETGETSEKSLTPTAPPESPTPARSTTTDSATAVRARDYPPPRSNVPRYAYRSPARPASGDRRHAEAFFSEALKSHKARRLTSAVEGYRQAIKLDPSYYEACYNLGLATYDLKDYAQSLVAYELALAIHPDSREARFNFALALQQAGYPQDAVHELEKLLDEHGNEARLHFTLAKLYSENLRDIAAARRHYQRVLQLDPQHPAAVPIRYWLADHP